MSKLEPLLLIVTVPSPGALQLNQTERPPSRHVCRRNHWAVAVLWYWYNPLWHPHRCAAMRNRRSEERIHD